ncbi:kinase-like domain-containing protein [Flammula alnicola]|nr:kinase-like domain-containing protein [Flammula alnicola]
MAGRPAMVMQWYHNGSAAEYLAHKNQNADRLQLILDIALGLEYLHTHKPPIVHADLKGNNVLITDGGRAALCDFGLSQVVEDLGRPAGLTLSDPNVGPLRWQAPELSNDDEPATLSSDVWSFGCTAFELLTSHIPYPHLTRDAQVLKDMHNGKKPSGTADVALLMFDSRVRALLDSCWRFTPVERPHMTQVRTQLEAICVSRANQPQ